VRAPSEIALAETPPHPKFKSYLNFDLSPQAGRGKRSTTPRAAHQHDVVRQLRGDAVNLGVHGILADNATSRALAADEIERHPVAILAHQRIIFDVRNVSDMHHEIIRLVRRGRFDANDAATGSGYY